MNKGFLYKTSQTGYNLGQVMNKLKDTIIECHTCNNDFSHNSMELNMCNMIERISSFNMTIVNKHTLDLQLTEGYRFKTFKITLRFVQIVTNDHLKPLNSLIKIASFYKST